MQKTSKEEYMKHKTISILIMMMVVFLGGETIYAQDISKKQERIMHADMEYLMQEWLAIHFDTTHIEAGNLQAQLEHIHDIQYEQDAGYWDNVNAIVYTPWAYGKGYGGGMIIFLPYYRIYTINKTDWSMTIHIETPILFSYKFRTSY